VSIPRSIRRDSELRLVLVWHGLVALLLLLDALYPLNEQVFASACLVLLISIIYQTWNNTGQGNHPIFLFMLFLLLFQYGRMISWLIDGEWAINQFDLTVDQPFDVPESVLKYSLLLVLGSAIYVYAGFFLAKGPKQLRFTQNENCRTFFGWLYFLTVPFVIYKGASYLKYTLDNGGYIATYLGEGEQLEQVGIVVRALALLNTMALMPYLIVETRTRLLWAAVISAMLAMVLELLVGFRGKFFIYLMFFWLVLNIKRGSSFKPITGVLAALILTLIAVGAEIFRESKSGMDINVLAHFFYTQGNSFFVTVSSVLYHDLFEGRAWAYVFEQFLTPYVHLSKFPPGSLFTLDLTAFLSSSPINYAFGTGEAYLAHLYLLGGVAGICIGSLLLGWFSSWLGRIRSVFGQTLAMPILLWVPFMPRGGYLEPLALFSKYAVMSGVAFALYFGYRRLAQAIGAQRIPVSKR
jgi:hypothetical protein